ncbi:hypothetical protein [Demequina zhanjiangensis]|uniref:Uncharacterized protein n=1 Tax=Demequina zhanjiangensis TaxID=3051659 RepID=A0ABT8G2T8_9MICO|nr:hypothetical protein [Demequina sp. SYSU T00b26]MDN4473435.1 hypothetical protein [Demequina sp. SYSU T00b26]
MTETLVRARAARAFATMLVTGAIAIAPVAALAHEPSKDVVGPSPASAATLGGAVEDERDADTSTAVEETDPFAADGYLDELLIGSAAAVAVLLLGAFLMRRA